MKFILWIFVDKIGKFDISKRNYELTDIQIKNVTVIRHSKNAETCFANDFCNTNLRKSFVCRELLHSF